MPIKPENLARYPKDWPRIRQQILARAGNECERCGVSNHAVGYRDRDGAFVPARGNGPCDAAGQGLVWPSGQPLPYEDARDFTDAFNDHITSGGLRCDGDGNRWIIIVLTIAHLDHQPENNDPANLAALCRKCHNLHDHGHRFHTRREAKGQFHLFQEGTDARPTPA